MEIVMENSWSKIYRKGSIFLLWLKLQWRKTNDAVHFGKMKHYVPENNVYVYFRYTDNKSVMVILNNSSQTQNIKTNRFQESIQNYRTGKEVLTGKTIDLKNKYF